MRPYRVNLAPPYVKNFSKAKSATNILSYSMRIFERRDGRDWKWVQKFNPNHLYHCRRVSAILIDETMSQIGAKETWLWVAAEPIHKQILGVYVSRHRNMIAAELFLEQDH
jgi:hypothetical protein